MKKQTLNDWIEKLGPKKVAELLGTAESTVRHWRRGHCLPRAEQMREIKRLSKGRVSYDDIIDGKEN